MREEISAIHDEFMHATYSQYTLGTYLSTHIDINYDFPDSDYIFMDMPSKDAEEAMQYDGVSIALVTKIREKAEAMDYVGYILKKDCSSEKTVKQCMKPFPLYDASSKY